MFRILLALVFALVIFRMGLAMIRVLATPLPEPPPPGELRKVRLTFQCAICGAEVQMRMAPSQDPEPPRHCMDEMRLMTPVEDL